MVGYLAVQDRKKASVLPASRFLQHTAVQPIADRADQLEPASALTESRFGQDFSQVAVHAGTDAVRSELTPPCPVTSTRCPFGGACHTCPVQVQAKLVVNQPGDEYEQEADRVAEQVMHTHGASLQHRATGQVELTDVPPAVYEVLRSSGQPLDHATRAFMESRLGHDFGQVRVHADAQAAESARAMNALAYTVDRNIIFGSEQYTPATDSGRRLLAHELVHVVQQGGDRANGSNLATMVADDLHEYKMKPISARLNDTDAEASALHLAPKLRHAHPGTVQRVGPIAATAAGATAGAIVAIVSFEAALDYAKSLATRFPGWLSALPNCPCRENDVIADTVTWGRDRNPALSWFHPGAASSYRSNSTFVTVPGSSHGQQCTYDSSGNLITEGPGAGTPDSWSPNTNGARHTWYDVASWQLLGWRIYNQYWRPNNGNGCTANRGDQTFMRRLSEFIP